MIKYLSFITMFLLFSGCTSQGQTKHQAKKDKTFKQKKEFKHPIFEGYPVSFFKEGDGYINGFSIESSPFTKVIKPAAIGPKISFNSPEDLLGIYLGATSQNVYDTLFYENPKPILSEYKKSGPTVDLRFNNLGNIIISIEGLSYCIVRVEYFGSTGENKGIKHFLMIKDKLKKEYDSKRWYLYNEISDQNFITKIENPSVAMLIDWAINLDYKKARYLFRADLEEGIQTPLSEEELRKLISLKKEISVSQKNRIEPFIKPPTNRLNWVKIEKVFAAGTKSRETL